MDFRAAGGTAEAPVRGELRPPAPLEALSPAHGFLEWLRLRSPGPGPLVPSCPPVLLSRSERSSPLLHRLLPSHPHSGAPLISTACQLTWGEEGEEEEDPTPAEHKKVDHEV